MNHLDREENCRYKKVGLVVLSRALDDICPKFSQEPEEVRVGLVKDRIKYFKEQEKLLDNEWKQLEREATQAVVNFNKSRKLILKNIEKTRKTARIKSKITELKRKKVARTHYLTSKKTAEVKKLTEKIEKLHPESKKYAQITKKLTKFVAVINDKLLATENRYNRLSEQLLLTDNSTTVDDRLKKSGLVWERKFKQLKHVFQEKEDIYNSKRFEQDQVRLAVQGFEENTDMIKHWCTQAGVPLLTCYLEVKERLTMMGRSSDIIDRYIENARRRVTID